MAGRGTSPTLIGRGSELALLAEAMAAAFAGRARIVLVAGDAGIGKTRLIGEAAARAEREGAVSAVGGCVQLGTSSLAYAPLIQALRGVRSRLGEDAFDEVTGPARSTVDAMLGLADGTDRQPGAVFELLLGLLRRLGERQPVLLAFEDLHWADPSTRDFVAFLGRNLQDARVVLALTYRADELHRRHPWLPVVAELERDPQVERITLSGLEHSDLVELVAQIGGSAEVPVEDLVRRTAGNPFYVEELVAAGSSGDDLPATVAEVILSRVRGVPEPVPEVLSHAAVLGEAIDDDWLAEMTGRPIRDVTEALREAVSRHLLAVDRAGCRFRHALVREALYDDLLPRERERLHAAAARLLQERPLQLSEHVRQSLLAYHARAAGDLSTAFAASVRAGLECERVFALADAASQYEHAIELWDRVLNPDAAAGMARWQLLLRAADAVASSSFSPRSVSLAEAALAALPDDASPEQHVIVLERIGSINITLARPVAATVLEGAVAMVADRPPSLEKAVAVSAYGTYLFMYSRWQEAEPVLREAIRIADVAGVSSVRMAALSRLGSVLVYAGRPDEGLALGDEALRLARKSGTAEDVCRGFVNQSDALLGSGRYAEAEAVAAEGTAYSIQTGYHGFRATVCNNNRIWAMYCGGRWREAERVELEFDSQVPPVGGSAQGGWVNVLLGQGRIAEARPAIDSLLEYSAVGNDVQFRAGILIFAAELAELEQRWNEARDLLDEALTLARGTDDQFYANRAYASALRVERRRIEALAGHRAAEQIRRARQVADERIGQMRDLARRLDAVGIGLLPEPAAWLRTAEAEHAAIHGTATSDTWAAVIATWDAIGQPFPAASARFRYADALLREHGDREEIRHQAAIALEVAERLGAEPLAAEIRLLAQRGRLDLAPVTQPQLRAEPDGVGITARESEVLTLLAEGRTNREIGRALFISEKTASVHVSNLLRKLGAVNRVEAAAIAQRLQQQKLVQPAEEKTIR